MKITRCVKACCLMVGAALFTGLGFIPLAAAQERSYLIGLSSKTVTEIGRLGGDYSRATGINDAGQLAGFSATAEGARHAFISGPNGMGMIDLNSLVNLSGGVFLSRVMDINNEGQVIVYAIVIPKPESYALFLAGLALAGFIARRKKTGGEDFSLG
jgi:probable HAF family extracellular repeat protein